MRVLVIDDSRTVRARLLSLLSEAGLVVVGEASDGLEALSLISEHVPDVIILDLEMPRMGGLEVLRRLRLLQSPPRTIVYTNHGGERYRAECLRLGAESFLDKSSEFEHVITAVTRRGTPGS
jgi:two-component system response regulator EvgA